jgi:hypothetical protein
MIISLNILTLSAISISFNDANKIFIIKSLINLTYSSDSINNSLTMQTFYGFLKVSKEFN